MSSLSVRHPRSASEPFSTGGKIEAWYIPGNPGDSTDIYHGRLGGTYTDAGGSQTTITHFQYWTGSALVDMLVQDDSFGLTFAHDPRAPWVLTVLVATEGLPSTWYSTDNGATWTRVTGTGGGTEARPTGVDDGTL